MLIQNFKFNALSFKNLSLAHVLACVFLFSCLIPITAFAQNNSSEFIPLEPNSVYTGRLEEKQVLRFSFSLDKSLNVVLESHTSRARSNNVYPEAVLFRADGTVLARSWSGGQGRNFKIKRQLQAGDYVLRVEDARGCGSLHGCPEILRDFKISFAVEEISPF